MAKEIPVAERLQRLYDLQQIDSKIDEIEILKGELPIEVSDLEDEIVGLQTRIERLQNNIKDLDGNISRFHAQINEAETLMARYQSQLDNVANNREYEALTKELDMQKLDIQLAERRIREANTEKAAKEDTLEAALERLEKKQKNLAVKKVELEEITEKTRKEEEALRKQSAKAREKIEDRLLRSYDKTRHAYRNGLAVVTVQRDSCGGCFNKIPPQVQLEISMQKKIIVCEHCGRILVDTSVVAENELEEKA